MVLDIEGLISVEMGRRRVAYSAPPLQEGLCPALLCADGLNRLCVLALSVHLESLAFARVAKEEVVIVESADGHASGLARLVRAFVYDGDGADARGCGACGSIGGGHWKLILSGGYGGLGVRALSPPLFIYTRTPLLVCYFTLF